MWPPVVQLVVAKCWDSNPKDYFTVPRTEPVRSGFLLCVYCMVPVLVLLVVSFICLYSQTTHLKT